MISRDKINYSFPGMKLITVNFFFSENSYCFKYQFVHLLSFKNRSSNVDENKLNTVYVDCNDKDIFIPFWQTWIITKSSKIKLFKSDFQGSIVLLLLILFWLVGGRYVTQCEQVAKSVAKNKNWLWGYFSQF